MSVSVIQCTSIEGYEVEIFIIIANKNWVELGKNLDFHGADFLSLISGFHI